jgi:hypothetical protein
MAFSIFALAAAAAAQAATPHTAISRDQARAQGFAQAQQALTGGGTVGTQGTLTVSAPVAAPIAAPVMTNAVLRVGTEVPLRLVEELTTKGKQLRVGSRFHLETSEPVLVQGVNVIPVGSPAMGEITDVRNKGMWGKSGHLAARVLYVTVNGRQIRLSGAFDDKGVTGTAGVVAAIVFVPVVGFFTTGTSAKVPSGSIVKGFVDEDVALSIPVAVQAPMVVGGAAVPMTVQAAAPVAGRR